MHTSDSRIAASQRVTRTWTRGMNLSMTVHGGGSLADDNHGHSRLYRRPMIRMERYTGYLGSDSRWLRDVVQPVPTRQTDK